MRPSPVALAATLAAAALIALASPARAETERDPCRDADVGVDGSGLACGPMQFLVGGDQAFLPFYGAYDDLAEAPGTESLRCPDGSWIKGTDYWSRAFAYNWDWDYFVDGGEWIVWGSGVGKWPASGTVPGGQPGYNAVDIELINWRYGSDEVRDTKVFWKCVSGDSKLAAPPSGDLPGGGDGGNDNLRGNGDENALIGFAGHDRLRGHGGADHLHGGSGRDTLLGGGHDDLIHGGHHPDKALGGTGSDDILTGRGHDVARGGAGDDQLFDDQGRDLLIGGAGDDRFSARDGNRDLVRCGAGRDVAVLDRLDAALGCERVLR